MEWTKKRKLRLANQRIRSIEYISNCYLPRTAARANEPCSGDSRAMQVVPALKTMLEAGAVNQRLLQKARKNDWIVMCLPWVGALSLARPDRFRANFVVFCNGFLRSLC